MACGAAGAVSRWAVELAVPSVGGFPLATLLINVSGAFGLGLLGVLLLERLPPTRYLRPLLGIGFLGAYTTFSTMAMEGVRLVEDGARRYAAWNLVLSGPLSFAGALGRCARREGFEPPTARSVVWCSIR